LPLATVRLLPALAIVGSGLSLLGAVLLALTLSCLPSWLLVVV